METRIVAKQEIDLPAKYDEKFDFSVHVSSLSNIERKYAVALIYSQDGEKYLKKPLTGEIRLTYPLGVDVYLKIKNCASVGGLLWDISQVYKEEIYKDPKRYGIWGHSIGDLYFESITIFHNGSIELGMGS